MQSDDGQISISLVRLVSTHFLTAVARTMPNKRRRNGDGGTSAKESGTATSKRSSGGTFAKESGNATSKRSSGGTNNPLSDARKSSAGKSVTKQDQNALALWHRKSGAGYALFVSYYGSQPVGVVVDAADVGVVSGGYAISPVVNGGQQRGKGMSRAAKRRKKKKGQQPQPSTSSIPESELLHVQVKGSCPVLSAADESHPLFQAYASQSKKKYPHLGIYIRALSRPLPLTFRLRNPDASSTYQEGMSKLLSGEHLDLVAPVKYDPNERIYQATAHSRLSKANLTKTSPELKKMLVDGSLNGTLARQELGSMLPVLALSSLKAIVPGCKVLDLCASPGSKTMQALEIAAAVHPKSGKRGRVIANDVHVGRLDSLRDAVGRSGLDEELTARITYTNFDASQFPLPRSGKLFDAIIADVPCSGDGTIRKDKFILPMWTPATGNALHGLQLKILIRALELVRVGGVVCYSTCSLNPVEDEAVVSAALRKINDKKAVVSDASTESDDGDSPAVELVEWPSSLLPTFKRQSGVSDWKIATYEQGQTDDNDGGNDSDEGAGDDFGTLRYFASYEDARKAGMEQAKKTMWPKSDEDYMHLELCSRLLPQAQDTGGFFVSLLRRNR